MMLKIVLYVISYFVIVGVVMGYALCVIYDEYDLSYVDCDEMIGAFVCGLFWPITLPMLMFHAWMADKFGGGKYDGGKYDE